MSLTAGQRPGLYEILSALGAGGMVPAVAHALVVVTHWFDEVRARVK